MPHEITSGPQPNIVILRVYGDLTKDDLSVNEELGLNAGHVIYLLADLSKMSLGIPDKFLTTARQSAFSHPDVKHVAVYATSTMLTSLAKVVTKLARKQEKVTFYWKFEDALAQLVKLAGQAD